MDIEREAKLLAIGPSALDRLAALDRLEEVRLGPGEAVDELDRYVDTADGHLARRAWACRIRTRDGATIASLKGPATAGDRAGIHRREEVEGPTDGTDEPAGWPPSRARDLLRELSDGQPLSERFRLEQRRIERPMHRGDQRVGILSLDTVRVRRGERAAGTFHVAELELVPDAVPDPAAALELLGRLVTAATKLGGLEPDASTKLERALTLLDR